MLPGLRAVPVLNRDVCLMRLTVSYERTRAVLDAREFLICLSVAVDKGDLSKFRARALVLLSHYPEAIHLNLIAAMAPDIWAEPEEDGRG